MGERIGSERKDYQGRPSASHRQTISVSPQAVRSAEERRAAIATYLLARDWEAARQVVESDLWFLTGEAEEEFGFLEQHLQKSQVEGESGLTLRLSVVVLARAALVAARDAGTNVAFDDLISLESGFTTLSGARWLSIWHTRLRDEPDFLSDRGFDALRLMALRAANYDPDLTLRLARLTDTVRRARKDRLAFLASAAAAQQSEALRRASAILEELRAIPPQDATPESFARCELALALLELETGSDLWLEVQIRLGSFLLELREGDRASNVSRACTVYRAVLDMDVNERDGADTTSVMPMPATLRRNSSL